MLKNRWLKICAVHILLIAASVILGMLFFVQIEMDADMAGTIVALHKQKMYLGQGFQWMSFSSYTPWNIASWISYNIFGITEDAVKLITTIFFTACCFIIMELGIDNYEEDGLTAVPVMFFMLIPGIAVNKYHFTSTIVILLALLYIKKRVYVSVKMRRITDIAAGVIFIWLFFATVDKMLIILNLLCPIFLYILYIGIKKKKNLLIINLCALGAVLFSFLWYLYNLGHSYAGISLYGADSYYLTWADFSEMWSVGIEFLIKTVTRAMNISAAGSLVQPMTLVWVVKILLVILSITVLLRKIKKVLRDTADGINNLYPVIVCGAVILSVLLYLINGVRINLYKTYGYHYSYCGYMSMVWFMIPLLGAEGVKAYVKKAQNHIQWLRVSAWAGCGMLSIMSMSECVSVLASGYQNIDKQIADYLVGIGAEGGMAIYMDTYTVTVWSGGKVYMAGDVFPDEENKWAYRRFDTDIEVRPQNEAPDPSEEEIDEMILARYGKWEKAKTFMEDPTRTAVSDYPQESLIYYFDHDIRWPVRSIDEALLSGKRCRVFLPLGENRITLYGSGMKGSDLDFEAENDTEIQVICHELENDQIVYKVICPEDTIVNIGLREDEELTHAVYDRAEIDMLRAAICLHAYEEIQEDGELELKTNMPDGTYNIIVNGNNLDDIELICQTGDVQIDVLQNGSIRKIYRCVAGEDKPVIRIMNHGEETAVVNNVYYEATIEDRDMVIEKLKEE